MIIEDLVIKHEIPYKIKGNDIVIRCMSGEHEDTVPSLRIDKDSGLFYCFSCEFKGGIVQLMKLLGEPEPSQSLKLQVKVSMLHDKLEPKRVIDIVLPDIRSSVNSFRNLSKETLSDHSIFVVPDTSNYNELIGRICIPIVYRHKIKFIEARALSSDAHTKYIRYPEHSSIDFILSESCGAPLLVLVEGIFDYLRLYDLGIRNCTPLFGLGFKYNKAKHILNEGFIGVIDMLDNDAPGNKASENIQKICKYNELIYKRFVCDTDPGDITEKSFSRLCSDNKCEKVGDYLL